jgi:hypothetical protein
VQTAQSPPEQVFRLAKLALEAKALGDSEARDDAPLDFLAGVSGSFARPPIQRSRLIVDAALLDRLQVAYKETLKRVQAGEPLSYNQQEYGGPKK